MLDAQETAGPSPADPPAKPDEAGEPPASPQPPYNPPKRIILLSDGTGNSSGKLFKTNVWRLYQALDLGPGGTGTVQIADYNNGVGTSSFKPLAILGGVLGYGLKRNILHLYRFLCRNYTPGDEIFAFGFSRGAFTIRLLVALIGSQGVVPYINERDLTRQSADAYREFCRDNRANVLPWGTSFFRVLRDIVLWIVRIGKPKYRPGVPGTPVRFVGVWDTVAAYGGPIIEITRAIDDWIWPMTMTDYRLGDHVVAARHALAIDDERDAFQPLLWDEFHERWRANAMRDPKQAETARERLQQVWFAGMHADVGGGYPDDSLSYVSLDWMMDHADAAGLTFMKTEADRIAATANSFGPIHDSREGAGVYYRYQPRKIEALLHVGTATQPGAPGARPMSETLILRDPRVGEKPERPRGLLLSCSVHESVLSRIETGTDNYAPITLPRCFDVAPAPPPRDPTNPRRPLIAPATVTALAATAQERAEKQEVIWDWVWFRRGTYFVTLSFTLSLVLMPWWLPHVPPIPSDTDGRWVLGSVIGWLNYVLPGFAHYWVEAFAAGSLYFLGICVVIATLIGIATKQEQTLRDHTRELWWAAMDPAWPKGTPLPGKPDSALRDIRNARWYQAPLQFLKWRLLPWLLGPAMILAMWYALAIVVIQARMTVQERSDTFCPGGGPIAAPAGANFLTGRSCNLIPVTQPAPDAAADANAPVAGNMIEAGRTYRIVIEMLDDWKDGDTPADPTGLKPVSFKQRVPQWLGAPFRRIVTASAMTPLIEIRSTTDTAKNLHGVSIDALTMTPVAREPRRYSTIYTARRSGQAYMFVNEAVFPDWLVPNWLLDARPDWFYTNEAAFPDWLVPNWLLDARPHWFYTSTKRGNHGSAKITIEPTGE